MKLTDEFGTEFVINPAFMRHYGDRFTMKGLRWVASLNGKELLALINFMMDADERMFQEVTA